MSALDQLIGAAITVSVSLAIPGVFLRVVQGRWPWVDGDALTTRSAVRSKALASEEWDFSKKGCGLPCGYDCNGACFQTNTKERP